MKKWWSILWPHAAHLIVGVVFIYAGWIKIIDTPGFAKNIYQYQLIQDIWVNLSAIILPWLELVTGIILIFIRPLRRGAAAWIGLMLVVFTTAVIISILRGLDISCGCMSTSPDAAKIGWRKVAENTGLFLLTILSYLRAGREN
ncbi:MAG: MauE/DoxX family redox-associated membrane protein [Kiritimatiellia bacterium]